MTAPTFGVEAAVPTVRASREHRLNGRSHLVMSPLLLVLGIAAWEYATRAELLPPLVFAPPSRIVDALGWLLGESWFYEDVWITTYETLVGFGLALVLAIVLAVAVTHSAVTRRFAMPYIVFFQVLPKVVLAPVFIAWLGFDLRPKILLAGAISFFPVLTNAVKGIEQVPENSHRLMRSLGAGRRQTFRMLVIPAGAPFVLAGIRAGVTLALIGAVVGEFVTARAGLGRLVTTFSANYQLEEMWAATFAIGILGLLLYGAAALLTRLLVRWQP